MKGRGKGGEGMGELNLRGRRNNNVALITA